MAGPAKKRAQAEKQPNGSSNGSSSESRDPTQRSALKSIPRVDGNRDPSGRAPVDYSDPRDLKNISDFLGIAGWYQARGVSANTLLSQPEFASCTYPPMQTYLPSPHCRPCKQLRARILPRSVWVRCLSCEHKSWLFLSLTLLLFLLSFLSKTSFGSCHIFGPKSTFIISIFPTSLISHLYHD
jgi:hypothetical protein